MRGFALACAFAAVTTQVAACAPSPQGVEIYPTAETLPANLLRFYLYFPRPMRPHDVLNHVAMRDEAGQDIPGVFLQNSYELWSPDRRRLTLLLDPGRVKTGLVAHDALGRALEPGAQYHLVIKGDVQDASGCSLGQGAQHRFTAGPADLDVPTPSTWSFNLPTAGSREPLALDLGTPHDHLSMAYRVRVLDGTGAIVPGAIDLGKNERVWSFSPQYPWADQPYTVKVDGRLEDLAGNRPGGLFDRPITAAPVDWTPELPFRPLRPEE